jgi:hypothetical protein
LIVCVRHRLVLPRTGRAARADAADAETYGKRASRLLAAALFGAAACSASPDRPGVATGPRRAVGSTWSYEVKAGPLPSLRLDVEAALAPTSADTVTLEEAVMPFVGSVEYADAIGWHAAPSGDGGWNAPCHATGCRLRYSIALGDAAARIDDVETAWAGGGLVVAPPSTWLLRPATDTIPSERVRFRVTTFPGVRFAAGVRGDPSASIPTFEFPARVFDSVSFAVFGAFSSGTVDVGAGQIDVVAAPQGLAIGAEGAVDWTKAAAGAIDSYYGLPAARALVVIAPGAAPVTRGETLGDGGPAVVVRAAAGFDRASVRDDWVLTHELVHATLPTLGRAHAWLEEGLATYVEPIARARAGLLPVERFWQDLVEGLPQGLPGAGDEGLERTRTWGRTYWGGALFCLVADVRIREETKGTRSLADGLRRIVASGADGESHWTVDQFLGAADHATGTTVLEDLYREMALAPGSVDLVALWARLGVRTRASTRPRSGPAVTFDDTAPLAWLRRAMTAPR